MELFIEQQFTPAILQEFARRFAVEVDPAPIGDFENFVFKAKTARGEARVLRVTHSSHRSRSQIEEELRFLNHLADGGVQVGRAFPAATGLMVEGITVGEDAFWGCLFAFVPGVKVRPGTAEWSIPLFQEWGKTIGRMHALTLGYPKPSHRPHWQDDEQLVKEWMDEELRTIGLEVFAEVAALKVDARSFGLIHSDVHQGNFFYDGASLHVFDFDDTMSHFFIHDLAIVLYYSFWWRTGISASKASEEARVQLLHLRRGYETQFQLEAAWYETLPLFLRLRDVVLHCVFRKKLAGRDIPAAWAPGIDAIRARIVAKQALVTLG